jgi:hypothetical protein
VFIPYTIKFLEITMKNKFFNVMIYVAVASSLIGCQALLTELEDGYQIGDITRATINSNAELKAKHESYCSETSPLLRELLMADIRAKVPDYPEGGLCRE